MLTVNHHANRAVDDREVGVEDEAVSITRWVRSMLEQAKTKRARCVLSRSTGSQQRFMSEKETDRTIRDPLSKLADSGSAARGTNPTETA
jgi:hypothetical protein